MRRIVVRSAAAALLLAAVLAAGKAGAGDPGVDLSIRNAGPVALRCMILFGHWITRDIGPIAPGGGAEVAMWRGQPAGALYIPRFDGRKMMIENLVCGSDAAWAETYEQIPLAALRDGAAAARFRTACKPGPQPMGKIACSVPAAAP
jgi:hypothetical protein